MHRTLAGLVVVLLAASVSGQDRPKPDRPEQAAEKVLAAFKAEDAAALKALAEKDDPDPWYTQVVKFICGEIAQEAFLAAAQAETPKKTSERQCEAFFYAGALREIAGQPKEARKLYLACAKTGVRNFIEYETSRIALKRIPR